MSHNVFRRLQVFGMRFLSNKKAMASISSAVIGLISIIIIAIAWLAMTPVIVDQVQAVNTTGWTFTGYEGAEALLGLIPFVWVGAGLAMIVVGLFGLTKIMKGAKATPS